MKEMQISLPFEFSGTVVQGKHLGHQIGFPTANIACTQGHKLPANGVYAGVARIGTSEREYVMIVNQGTQPTAPSGKITVEAHLIDFEEKELYGETIHLRCELFLRAEEKFPSLQALMNQLTTDCERAKQWVKIRSLKHES